MTREEAIKFAEKAVNLTDIPDVKEFYRMSGAALRPITREQVEKMRGEWQICNNLWNGCTPDYDCVCSMCGKSGVPNMDFCHFCGAPMTDEAVDILWKRLEAMHDAAD